MLNVVPEAGLGYLGSSWVALHVIFLLWYMIVYGCIAAPRLEIVQLFERNGIQTKHLHAKKSSTAWSRVTMGVHSLPWKSVVKGEQSKEYIRNWRWSGVRHRLTKPVLLPSCVLSGEPNKNVSHCRLPRLTNAPPLTCTNWCSTLPLLKQEAVQRQCGCHFLPPPHHLVWGTKFAEYDPLWRMENTTTLCPPQWKPWNMLVNLPCQTTKVGCRKITLFPTEWKLVAMVCASKTCPIRQKKKTKKTKKTKKKNAEKFALFLGLVFLRLYLLYFLCKCHNRKRSAIVMGTFWSCLIQHSKNVHCHCSLLSTFDSHIVKQ